MKWMITLSLLFTTSLRAVETKYADAGEIKIAYEEFGHPENPALILVMGLGAQMLYWSKPFCEGLADEGFRVIRFDHRDTGLSSKVLEGFDPNIYLLAILKDWADITLPLRYTLKDMADDVAGLMDALDIQKAHVAGVSMGGMIVQLLGIHHPDRLHSMSAIMTTTREPGMGDPDPDMKERLADATTHKPGTREEAVEAAFEFFQATAGPLYPPEESLKNIISDAYDRSNYPEGTERQLKAIIAQPSMAAELSSVTIPTLVIHGTADKLVLPSGGQHLHASLPLSKLIEIKGMGHSLPPQLYSKLIPLLAQHMNDAQIRRARSEERTERS